MLGDKMYKLWAALREGPTLLMDVLSGSFNEIILMHAGNFIMIELYNFTVFSQINIIAALHCDLRDDFS